MPVANAIWAGGNGSWDTPTNWTGYQVSGGSVVATGSSTGSGSLQLVGATAQAYSATGPTPIANVFIQVPGATVSGPASDHFRRRPDARLRPVGAASTLNLGAGGLYVTGAAGTAVLPTGVLNVLGGSLSTPPWRSAGRASADPAAAALLTVPGPISITGSLTANGGSGPNAVVDNTGGSLAITGTGGQLRRGQQRHAAQRHGFRRRPVQCPGGGQHRQLEPTSSARPRRWAAP